MGGITALGRFEEAASHVHPERTSLWRCAASSLATFQTPIADTADLTGIDFDTLSEADALTEQTMHIET